MDLVNAACQKEEEEIKNIEMSIAHAVMVAYGAVAVVCGLIISKLCSARSACSR